jgi:hypothetical protein
MTARNFGGLYRPNYGVTGGNSRIRAHHSMSTTHPETEGSRRAVREIERGLEDRARSVQRLAEQARPRTDLVDDAVAGNPLERERLVEDLE